MERPNDDGATCPHKYQDICKWITDNANEGHGAVEFSLESSAGMIGVWVGVGDEHEQALGYGDDAFEAVSDAIRREALQTKVNNG